MKFKAAILTRSKQPLEVSEIDLSDKLEYGQVLVKVHFSGICGAQINEIDAAKGPDKFLPHLLGHEASGEVLEIGPEVKTVKVGDHVVLHWRPSSGIQSKTPKYLWEGKLVNAGWVTTFNEKAVISENRLTIIPKDFDMRLAPLLGCAVTTAFGVINNDARVKIGQSLLIFGLGGVGLNIVQAASMVSANPIIGVDIQKNKIEMAKKYGLSHGIFGNSRQVERKVIDILGDEGADIVIDTTGNSRVIEQAYKLTSKKGKTIMVGVPTKGDNISIYSLPLHFNQILKGSEGGNSVPDVDIPRYINLIESGQMTLDGFITNEFKLEEINNALELFRSGKAGRILLNMQIH
tara:strand:- start:947 stop:1990 length:1044 start_codon:yes stop_codon:yes gene_type:complete